MSSTPQNPNPQGPDYGQQPGGHPGQPGQYPPHGYGQQPPKSSKKKWAIGCGILLILGILLFAGCSALLVGGAEEASNNDRTPGDVTTSSTAPSEGTGPSEPATAGEGVELNATATGTASVNWGTSDGQSSGSFTNEWSQAYESEVFEVYSIVVQDQTGAADAQVTCSISKDGEVLTEQTGTGAYAAITCSGS